MDIVSKVGDVWKRLSKNERGWLISESIRGDEINWRLRCKIVRNLARGERAVKISSVLGCSR